MKNVYSDSEPPMLNIYDKEIMNTSLTTIGPLKVEVSSLNMNMACLGQLLWTNNTRAESQDKGSFV